MGGASRTLNRVRNKLLIGTNVDNGVGVLQVNGMITINDDEDDLHPITTAKFKRKSAGITISTSAPVNPDLNPVDKIWIQYSGNNPKTIVAVHQHVNGKWNVGSLLNKVYTGWQHTVFLLDDGTVWVAGDNIYGQIGQGSTTIVRTMIQLDQSFNNPNKIVVGEFNTIIEKADGTVWGCGSNTNGQLGLGHSTDVKTFTQFSSLYNNPNKINILYTALYIERSDGTVWACGNNYNGNLCQGNTGGSSNVFVQIPSVVNPLKILNLGSGVIFIKSDSTIWGAGYSSFFNTNTSVNTGTLTQLTYPAFSEIYVNDGSVYLLQSDGTLQVIGNNSNGQLGLGDTTIRKTFAAISGLNIAKFFTGYYMCAILKTDGSLWYTGRNNGQFGATLNNAMNASSFVNTGIVSVKNVYANYFAGFIELNDNNYLYSGWNTQGELGDGSLTDYNRLVLEYTYK